MGKNKKQTKAKPVSNRELPATGSDETATETAGFPVVGIGASAGGFEACSQLLTNLPANTGMAFVFIQHLHPAYKSALAELLARSTQLPVVDIKDNMALEQDHVYVIPPNTDLEIFHGRLHLTLRKEHTPHLPIDRFFRSLAAEEGSKAIGVILSGTASDGVLGLKAIKAEGGITFSQDETSAKFDGMPHAAIATGCVDFIMPPDQIAEELQRIANHPYIRPEQAAPAEVVTATSEDVLNKIFILLRQITGVDFSYYKSTTIQRRIKRRMVLHKIDDIGHYVKYLQQNDKEVYELFQDILINVTDFFRDPEAFDVLKDTVFPKLLGTEPRSDPIRIWVPGCSTGEEVYSIAIVLLEHLSQFTPPPTVQIFATDINDEAIEKARLGIYPLSIAEHVPPDRLKRFFVVLDNGFQVKKSIRDCCIFARQNVFKDPPFSKIDLISCRNLLIYLTPVLQKRIFTVFHYALTDHGVLFLGSAETIGEHSHLFALIDQKHKIYKKKSSAVPLQLDFAAPVVPDIHSLEPATEKQKPTEARKLDLQQIADRLIIQKFAPAAVVVDDQMQILQFRGHTGRYLEPAPGDASLNLVKMAREGLLVPLRSLLNEAMQKHTVAKKNRILYLCDGKDTTVNIEITPLTRPSADEAHYYLVTFEEHATAEPAAGGQPEQGQTEEAKKSRKDLQIETLSQELIATKEYLQSVIEQQEVSNEELRSANEEIQSSNEELQSINEELETAKEELQSTNEELATVNDELETRNTQLARLNDDHTNVINSLEIAFVAVNSDLTIRSFTPQVKELLNIIDTDIGRPITDVKLKFKLPDLEQRIRTSIDSITSTKTDIQAEQGYWYSVRIRPYRTADNRIDGAVIAFLDINDLKTSLEEAVTEREYTAAVISAIRHPLLVVDKDLRVVSASDSYYKTFRVTAEQTLGNLIYRLGNGEWAIPQLREQLTNTVSTGGEFDDFHVEHDFENAGPLSVSVSGRPLTGTKSYKALALMQIEILSRPPN
ncbi:MAG: chemotaxis protein CheB [Gammaproteobacteria bacterium]|jgi:two-component system CheB/CheR fusion protein